MRTDPSHGDLAEWILGSWRVLSVTTTDAATGAKREPFGPSPTGYLVYTSGGRMMTMIGAAERARLPAERQPTESELAAAFMSAAGYTGRYSIQNDHIVHHIDVCSLPNWSGTTQTRYLQIDGERLILSTSMLDTPAIGAVCWSMVWIREH